MVVRDLMKSYIPCTCCRGIIELAERLTLADFSNPIDPVDESFAPHPTKYPVTELEYPNNGASERFIILAPRDKDHYNPIMCLESTLMAIVESESCTLHGDPSLTSRQTS